MIRDLVRLADNNKLLMMTCLWHFFTVYRSLMWLWLIFIDCFMWVTYKMAERGNVWFTDFICCQQTYLVVRASALCSDVQYLTIICYSIIITKNVKTKIVHHLNSWYIMIKHWYAYITCLFSGFTTDCSRGCFVPN